MVARYFLQYHWIPNTARHDNNFNDCRSIFRIKQCTMPNYSNYTRLLSRRWKRMTHFLWIPYFPGHNYIVVPTILLGGLQLRDSLKHPRCINLIKGRVLYQFLEKLIVSPQHFRFSGRFKYQILAVITRPRPRRSRNARRDGSLEIWILPKCC